MDHSCGYSKSQTGLPAGGTGRKLWLAGILLILLILGLTRTARGQGGSSGNWQGADIGAPGAAGSESLSGGVLTITGGGSGVYGAFSSYTVGDHGHFTYQPVTGDVEIVARVQSFSGGAKAEVGLMLREATDAQANMACTLFQAPSQSNRNPDFVQACRRPGIPWNPNAYSTWSGTSPPINPPCWLKLVRIGANYTTYRSSDGLRWCPIQDTAGGGFATTSAFEAGFFVSSSGGAAATAVIDSIYLGPPRPEYTTSWVGNSFSNDVDRYVSNGITALYVLPDGRCYTNSYYDEAGEPAKLYQNGRVVQAMPFGGNGAVEGSVTGDGQYVYLYSGIVNDHVHPPSVRVYRTNLDGTAAAGLTFDSGTPVGTLGFGGMAAGNGKIYFSDEDNSLIRVVDATSLTELPSLHFAFTRPGPMAIDGRGDLWIIQRATDFPNAGNFTPNYPAAILCYRPDGTPTGQSITDLVNPSAVSYDFTRDQLLVCENGPDQNIRIYSGLAGTPSLLKTWGTTGGLFTGGTPGLLNDPGSGGFLRLYSPNGVGVDSTGNYYISCASAGAHLRKYDPNGNLLWSVSGLPFTECPDFDPTTDGQDLYWQNAHYTLDYSKSTPGSEWNYTGLSLNPFGPDFHARPDGGAVFRRFGPNNDRFMFVMPAKGGAVSIYRYNGELAIPCGRIGADNESTPLWVDTNGDGLETADEDSQASRFGGFPCAFDVDSKGDLYILRAYIYDWAAGRAIIRHFHCLGVNAQGVPLYSADPSAYEDEPIPAEMPYPQRFRYDAANDTMYLLGYQVQIVNNPAPDTLPGQPALVAYTNWSQPSRAARFLTVLLTPYTDPNFFYFDDPAHNQSFPSGDGFQYYAMDVAGDKIFVGELWGPIHVYDAVHGNPVTRLLPGPEVSGVEGWTDIFGGVRAFLRSTGEYVVVREDAGYRGRNLMFRWTPQATAGALSAPTNLMAEGGSDRIRLTWNGGFGLLQKYSVWRGTASGAETLLADNVATPQYDDTTAQFGVPYYYRVTASNEAGTSPFSNEVVAAANTAAVFAHFDTTTLGNWLHAYGTEGYTVVNDSASYPPTLQVTPTGDTPFVPPAIYTWATSTTDPNALQRASGTGRVGAIWHQSYNPRKPQVELNLTDGRTHQVALYVYDWLNYPGSSLQVDIFDDFGKRINTQTISQAGTGKYAVWNLSGHLHLVFTPGSPPLEVSGLFIDPVADNTPPVTTASLNPAANQNGWNNTATTVTLTASDNPGGSGVQKIIYSLNGGTPVTVNGATTGINLTAEGVTALSYYAVDNAGNIEALHTLNVQIDETAPTTVAAPSGTTGNNGWYTGPVSVTLTANDTNGSLTTSGVAQTTYSVDGGAATTYTGAFTVSSDGSHTVTFSSMDNAGNLEAPQSFSFQIDTTPPTTSPSLSGPAGSNGWYTGTVQVTLAASDATSGVAQTLYSIDGGASLPYTGAISVSGDGRHTVQYYSVDNAGNTEPNRSTTVNIDSRAPTVAFGAPTPAPNAAGWNNSSVSIPFTAADSLSGVAATVPASSPLVLSAEGSSVTGTVTATDGAGNSATYPSPAVKIDKTPPTLAVSNIAATATSASGAVVSFTPQAADSLSGLAGVVSTPASGSLFPPGNTTVTTTATDNAGNSTTQSFLVTVTYSWSNFLQPINADGSSVFKLGSTIPVKFQLTGASAGITNAVATLTYSLASSNTGQVNEAVSTSAADTGNQFRYDPGSGQYIFNWSTKGLTTGTYLLQINLGDGVSRTVQIGLR